MINYNETLLQENSVLSIKNRGFAFGDAIFETIKSTSTSLLFFEDHYFRLMASLRIMRMEIPMNYTMAFFEKQIQLTLKANQLHNVPARVKVTVFREGAGRYTPETNDVSFVITVSSLTDDAYCVKADFYQVDLYKDHYVSPSLLSTLKTNNKALNVIGSIYAKENKLNNCLLINTNKHVVEALNGNLFLVKDQVIKTPPLTDGCLKGVMRTQILNVVNKLPGYQIIEASIAAFELQKADELFITNVIQGIQPITNYRKKEFTNEVACLLLDKLNKSINSL